MQVSDHDAALIGAFAAVALWLVRWRTGRDDNREQARARADRDKTVLIRTLAGVLPARRVAKTIPMRRAL